jgi:hypothetical protein
MPKRNCDLKIGVAILLLTMTLVLIGCESFPKPRSDSDILFAVPVVYLDSQRAPSRNISFGYRIILENTQTGERKHVSIDSSSPYKFVKNWSEGEYLIKEYSSFGFVDNWTRELKINQYLKLEKGKISIFPCKVVIILLESTSHFYDTSIAVDFIPLYEDDYRRIREFLSTYENYHFW